MRRRWLLIALSLVVAVVVLRLTAGYWGSRPEPDAIPPADPQAFLEQVRPTDPRSPLEEEQSFHLPDGFEMQLFAAEPQIGKPLNMAFDARGRLWVTQSREYPFPAPAGKGRDRVSILEDTDGDGRADKVTVFADGLNIPLGVIPVKGGAVVYSVPYIYRFFDFDGDDRADDKVVLYGPFGHKDTHGMVNSFTWGFDGWIYACHGFVNTSEIHAPDGSSARMTSGNTFRILPSGVSIDHYTFGQVNPFGLSFDALGNLYSADCHSRPVYQLLRGADYPHFAKTPSGLGFGPEMIDHHHGSTAIAGISYYAAREFPPEYRDNLFTGNVITSRINRDSLAEVGTTRLAVEEPDFVVSDDPWFRPVDLKLGPDGALYVADFYNRIIGHYEVPLKHPGRDRDRGRIWRIVYRNAKPEPNASDSDWRQASVEELLQDLGHTNLTVRILAANQLVDRFGREAVAPLQELLASPGSSSFQRIHGLWILNRMGSLSAEMLAAAALDSEAAVRIHAARVLAEYSAFGEPERNLALALLQDENPWVQRAAAEALRVHPDDENVRPLLVLRSEAPEKDTHLVYALRMALRDQLRDVEILESVRKETWNREQRQVLADVMAGVDSPGAAAFLLDCLEDFKVSPEVVHRYVSHIAAQLETAAIGELVRVARAQDQDLQKEKALFSAVLGGLENRGIPENSAVRAWGLSLYEQLLAGGNEADRQSAFEIAGHLKWRPAVAQLWTALASPGAAGETRFAAARALTSMAPEGYLDVFARLVRDPELPPRLRFELSRVLAEGDGTTAYQAIAQATEILPSRLHVGLANELSKSERGAGLLLDLVEKGKISPQVLLLTGPTIQFGVAAPDLKSRYQRLTEGLVPQSSELQNLVKERSEAFDPASASAVRGHEVFKKHCMRCHQIGTEGELIGPQLDAIGNRGVDRLFEDILDPHRNVDPAFRTHIFRLKNGTIVSGAVLQREGGTITLLDDMGDRVRIESDQIASQSESELSPMPSDFAGQIPPGDLNDLLAFLLSTRSE